MHTEGKIFYDKALNLTEENTASINNEILDFFNKNPGYIRFFSKYNASITIEKLSDSDELSEKGMYKKNIRNISLDYRIFSYSNHLQKVNFSPSHHTIDEEMTHFFIDTDNYINASSFREKLSEEMTKPSEISNIIAFLSRSFFASVDTKTNQPLIRQHDTYYWNKALEETKAAYSENGIIPYQELLELSARKRFSSEYLVGMRQAFQALSFSKNSSPTFLCFNQNNELSNFINSTNHMSVDEIMRSAYPKTFDDFKKFNDLVSKPYEKKSLSKSLSSFINSFISTNQATGKDVIFR